MASFLVTGASRGLGLGLVKVLAALPKDQVSHIIATSRSSAPAKDLSEVIDSSNGLISHIKLDVADVASIKSSVPEATSILNGKGLDYLVNNAAIREPGYASDLTKMEHLPECLNTNVVGTHETISAYLPLLRQGNAKKIVLFSSTLGCITTAAEDHFRHVPLPAYKISKAGTHMVTMLWSNQLQEEGFCVYMQSPGNLKTPLSGGDVSDLEVEVGAKETVRIMLEAKKEETGRHRNILVPGWENGGGRGGRYDGKDLPW